MRIEVLLDGEPFTPYVADGVHRCDADRFDGVRLQCSRGPIVDPAHWAQVLVPVSPHMLFDRAMVLGPETRVRLGVGGHRRAHLSVDGRSGGVLDVGGGTSNVRPIRFRVDSSGLAPRGFIRC